MSLGCRAHADGGAGSKGVKPSQRPQHSRHCGNWVRNTDGGSFSSPNYPRTYPPNKECLYVLEGNQQPTPEHYEHRCWQILILKKAFLGAPGDIKGKFKEQSRT